MSRDEPPTPPEELPDLVRRQLEALGEDPTREGLARTPERVARALTFLTQGYSQDPAEVFAGAVYAHELDEMVLVKNIEIYSLCEHHMLPFFGQAHIAYLPRGKILGLSKLPRVVDVFARRLQVQERLTVQIAEAINDAIAPSGVGVVIQARHLCMMMRGVQKQNSDTVTACMLGHFKTDPKTRAEFLQYIQS